MKINGYLNTLAIAAAVFTFASCKSSSDTSRPKPKGPTTEKPVEPIKSDEQTRKQNQPKTPAQPQTQLPAEGGDLTTHWESLGKGYKFVFKKAVSEDQSTPIIWNYKYAVYFQDNNPVNLNPLSDDGKKFNQDYCKISLERRVKSISANEVMYIDEIDFNNPDGFLNDRTKGSVDFIATDGGNITKITCHKYGADGKIYIQDVIKQIGNYVDFRKN